MLFVIYTDLRTQFLEIARKYSPEPRHVYAFLTTAIVRPFLPLSIYVSECDDAILIVVVWAGHTCYGRHAWDYTRKHRHRKPPICGARTLMALFLDPEVTNIQFFFSSPPSYGSWFSTP